MPIVVDKYPLEFSRNFDILDNQRLRLLLKVSNQAKI